MNKNKLKQIFRILLISGSLFSLYFVPWSFVKAWLTPMKDTVQEQLDVAVDQGFDGVVVYIDMAGQDQNFYASGWHNRDLKLSAKTDALFKIASISKLYDIVAVTKLVVAGRLSLDQSLGRYLPDLIGHIEYAEEITLRDMIQHKSGIPNFTDTPGFWAKPAASFEENLALILDKPANFKPGESYEYCNTNYLLINRIMDNTLGYNNFQFIQEQILDPLSLDNTFSSIKKVDMDLVMSGYHKGYPHDLKADEHGMMATAEDLGVFIRALNEGTIFGPGEQEVYSSIYEYEHGGWVPGYQSFAKYYEDIDAVIIAFYSTTDDKLHNWHLSELTNKRISKILEKGK